MHRIQESSSIQLLDKQQRINEQRSRRMNEQIILDGQAHDELMS